MDPFLYSKERTSWNPGLETKPESGWMDADAFLKWFLVFVDQIKERPLLLTHVTIPVILLAMEENIPKLPPHCTDLLQVLDKTGFGPLKLRWEKLLAERANTYGTSSLSRCEFVNLVCSIWKEGFFFFFFFMHFFSGT